MHVTNLSTTNVASVVPSNAFIEFDAITWNVYSPTSAVSVKLRMPVDASILRRVDKCAIKEPIVKLVLQLVSFAYHL